MTAFRDVGAVADDLAEVVRDRGETPRLVTSEMAVAA